VPNVFQQNLIYSLGGDQNPANNLRADAITSYLWGVATKQAPNGLSPVKIH